MEELHAIDPAIGALLLPLKRLRLHERDGLPPELIFIPSGKVGRRVQVFRGAVDFEAAFLSEGILEPLFNERDGQVRDVDADPLAIEFLRGVNGCATSTEWIENNVTLIATIDRQESNVSGSGSSEAWNKLRRNG